MPRPSAQASGRAAFSGLGLLFLLDGTRIAQPIDSTLVLKPLALAGTSTNMLHNMFIATTWVQLCTPYFPCTQRLALAPADAAECWTAPPIDDTLVSMPLALAGINMLHKMLICNMGATVHTAFSLHTKPSACACRCS